MIFYAIEMTPQLSLVSVSSAKGELWDDVCSSTEPVWLQMAVTHTSLSSFTEELALHIKIY